MITGPISSHLPDELTLIIISHLSAQDTAQFSLLSKICCQHQEKIWKLVAAKLKIHINKESILN